MSQPPQPAETNESSTNEPATNQPADINEPAANERQAAPPAGVVPAHIVDDTMSFNFANLNYNSLPIGSNISSQEDFFRAAIQFGPLVNPAELRRLAILHPRLFNVRDSDHHRNEGLADNNTAGNHSDTDDVAPEPANDDNNDREADDRHDDRSNADATLLSYHETTYELEGYHHRVWSEAYGPYSFIQFDDEGRSRVLSPQYGNFEWIDHGRFRLRDTDITVSFYPEHNAMIFSGTNATAVDQLHDRWHETNDGLDNN